MNKDEYWLLDSVVEAWCPLRWLVSKNVGEVLNKQDHGLSRAELISVLNQLFRSGDLLARRVENFVEKETFIPTQTDIEDVFDGRLECSYGLTLRGGARWEEVSQPRWERYLTAWVSLDPSEGEIVGSDLQMVKRCVSLSHYMLSVSVVSTSKHWDVLTPWQATYWKTLPKGHRVRFSHNEYKAPPSRNADLERWEWLKELNHWYTRYTGS